MRTKTINGETFQITEPYAPGHVLNEIEARVLNQVRAENIGNNMREAVKKAQIARDAGDAGAIKEVTAAVAKYDAEYTFSLGGGGSGSRKLDPYEREAIKISKTLLTNSLAAKGRKLSDVPADMSEEEWKAKVEAKIEELSVAPEVIKAAKKNVDAKKAQVDSLAALLAD